jgi:hypothetical protein
VDDAGNGAVRVFGEGILREPVFLQLLRVRDTLEPDRIARMPYQTEVVRVDPDVKE